MTGTEPRLELLRGLAGSANLRRRRFDSLPLRGPASPFTTAQARLPGQATTPEGLGDLISSIGEIGVLEPLLIEELPDPDGGPPRLRVVVGERRLRALRWGSVHLPDNPHFATAPAIICPGPLSDSERQIWQLVENFARIPLQPGELAAALLLYRCTILAGRLLKAGKPIPAEVYDLEDPATKFRALEKIRGANPDTAAPWTEVLDLIGLQISARKARELVRAFAELPRDLVEEMDAHKITLHTRIRFLQLRQGRAEAADGIWAAVATRARPDLLPAAVAAATGNPDLEADTALEHAEAAQVAANLARGDKLRGPTPEPAGDDPAAGHADTAAPMESCAAPDADPLDSAHSNLTQAAPGGRGRSDVDASLIDGALRALRAIAHAVRGGAALSSRDQNSFRLLIDEIAFHSRTTAEPTAASSVDLAGVAG